MDANTRMLHASVAAKCPNTVYFSYCNFFIKYKKVAKKRSFSVVGLAYDVDMRRNIPVSILFTRLTKGKMQMIMIYCLTGCNICSALFWVGKSIFKRMMQDALTFQELKDLGIEPLSNYQKFTCT